MFFNLSKSEWKEVGKHLTKLFIPAAIAAFSIALLGSSVSAPWLVIPLTPIVTGGGGWLLTKKVERNERLKAVARYTVMGLLFAIISFLSI